MEITVENFIEEYLEDAKSRDEALQLIATRAETLPLLQTIVHDFSQSSIQLPEFRERLSKALRPADIWFAQGRFMMEVNKFTKHHSDTSDAPANYFRTILTGLHAGNVGQRIEIFYNFLLKERERLRREGKQSNTIVAAGNSAYMISLFALWLDPNGEPIVCSEGIRKGLNFFMKEHLLPDIAGLKLNAATVEITTEVDYQAFKEALNSLLTIAPQLKFGPYWSEFFFYWVLERQQSLASSPVLVKEIDNSDILDATPTKVSTLRETNNGYTTVPSHSPSLFGNDAEMTLRQGPNAIFLPSKTITPTEPEVTHLIPHEPLKPTPEPLLTHLIHEVQRHILIDEATIRHSYYALLDGHVIFTGPPGTGKTELARLIPEILWQSEAKQVEAVHSSDKDDEVFPSLTTETAYTTRLVTATDDWSTRTLISGIVPQSKNGTVIYKVQFGHLTSTILKNWSFQEDRPEEWSTLTLQRTHVMTTSSIERGMARTFRGQWLVIDEFNRAPIDLALGDALTALGGHDVLRVTIESGSAELPIPQDFRIIGTLNSFDRNYLNQISEALKRRFSFIEILPPGRAQRAAEQGIVLYKALKKISHLSNSIECHDSSLYWSGVVTISAEPSGQYSMLWDDEASAFRQAFEMAWRIFEIIRIYRQLGTAQAISLFRQMLIAGILQEQTTQEAWIEHALDTALCSTIADQLQVLLPDEIESLFLYLTTDPAAFYAAYHQLLARLASTPQRLSGQLLALGSVHNEQNHPFLSDAQIDQIAALDQPEIPPAALTDLFHLNHAIPPLPQFIRRLRTFKAERGL